MEIREVKRNSESIKAEKSRRAKKRAALVGVFLILTAVIVIGILCFTVFFPIAEIKVVGNSLYSSEEIIEFSEVKISDKLFSVFSETVNGRVTKRLPYIKSVKLEKHLPDTLIMKVTETKDVFCFMADDIYYTADENYKILKETTEHPENVVDITVPDKLTFKTGETPDVEGRSLSLVDKIYSELTDNEISVNAIEISSYDTVTAKIANRFSVNFGADENIDGKIAHLKSMLTEISAKNGETCKGKIDLSAWNLQKREGYFELTANF